jgi:UDP-N-acetylmuramoyl-tripeptide--D-alanyl-D-alanine ligase
MKIEQLYNLFKINKSVSTDTRAIKKGSIFFALKGENFNGNKFAEDALKKGASYAIIDEEKYKLNDKFILVENVLEALQNLATYHRKYLKLPIISLTGSNGKTTTKELINTVLSKKYNTCATIGNLNNHIGVPLTLLSMNSSTEIGIVEMGANHLKEIELLTNIAQPDYGYITNFGKAHLEGFGSLEGVIKGKTELYDYLRKQNKKVFINSEDEIQSAKSKEMNTISFGKKDADYRIEYVNANPFVVLKFNNEFIESKLIGAYNFNNIAAAIAIGKYFDVSDKAIKEAIENYIPTNNRSQIIEKATNKIILDAYNANPSSMKVALESFSHLTDGSKIAILGDMFELGPEAESEHQKIVELVESINLDAVYLLGKIFYKMDIINPKIKKFISFEEFKEEFKNTSIENSTILIKASRGMALERILEEL